MFRPPTQVVRDLIIINVLMYIGTEILMPDTRGILASYLPGAEGFRPYQIFSHMFMHGSFGHLFFNMLGLYFFGPPLEMAWGPKRFLIFFISCGLGSWLLATGINYMMLNGSPAYEMYSSWGASGALYGILAGFAYMYPNQIVQLIFPPIPMKAKYFVLVFGALELFYGVSGAQTGVAHFAHVTGALVGFLLLVYWFGWPSGRR